MGGNRRDLQFLLDRGAFLATGGRHHGWKGKKEHRDCSAERAGCGRSRPDQWTAGADLDCDAIFCRL